MDKPTLADADQALRTWASEVLADEEGLSDFSHAEIIDGLRVALAAASPETDDERDARFAPVNDRTWGEGNWVRCPTCPPDSEGRQVYHHKGAHALAAASPPAPAIDAPHLEHQREWSLTTFGPGPRTGGVIDHIRKELVEIEADPTDLDEWVDVIILAFDGAWRAGHEPQQTIDAIKAKQTRNENRTWPDWRGMSENHAIEHDRSHDDQTQADT